MLEAGTKAPVFSLPDKDGNMISLEDYRGKRVVLYFYPRDNTPGCTREACAFAGAYEGFKPVSYTHLDVYKRQVWAITSAHCFNSWLISLSSRRDFLYLS